MTRLFPILILLAFSGCFHRPDIFCPDEYPIARKGECWKIGPAPPIDVWRKP